MYFVPCVLCCNIVSLCSLGRVQSVFCSHRFEGSKQTEQKSAVGKTSVELAQFVRGGAAISGSDSKSEAGKRHPFKVPGTSPRNFRHGLVGFLFFFLDFRSKKSKNKIYVIRGRLLRRS